MRSSTQEHGKHRLPVSSTLGLLIWQVCGRAKGTFCSDRVLKSAREQAGAQRAAWAGPGGGPANTADRGRRPRLLTSTMEITRQPWVWSPGAHSSCASFRKHEGAPHAPSATDMLAPCGVLRTGWPSWALGDPWRETSKNSWTCNITTVSSSEPQERAVLKCPPVEGAGC